MAQCIRLPPPLPSPRSLVFALLLYFNTTGLLRNPRVNCTPVFASSASHIAETSLGTGPSRIWGVFSRRKNKGGRGFKADLEPEPCAVEAGVNIFRVADRGGSTERGQCRPSVYTACPNADRCIKLVPAHLLQSDDVRLTGNTRRRVLRRRGRNTTAAA